MEERASELELVVFRFADEEGVDSGEALDFLRGDVRGCTRSCAFALTGGPGGACCSMNWGVNPGIITDVGALPVSIKSRMTLK